MFFTDLTSKFIKIIEEGAASRMSDKEFLEAELNKWRTSSTRRVMLDGDRYYNGQQDILNKTRTAIGADGKLTEVKNLPNNKLVDNHYANMVDQKVNYLLSKPVTFESGNDTYDELLKKVFNKGFLRQLKSAGTDVLNGGITWFYPFFDEKGAFRFQRFPSYEVLPFWKDAEHTMLDCAVRMYPIEAYEGKKPVIIEKVEVYTDKGVEFYELKEGKLILDNDRIPSEYITIDGKPYSWERIPLVAFKYNDREIPLIRRVKPLQDAYNELISSWKDRTDEDKWNTLLVIKNYDGTDLGEFRRNLATFGAVKVKTVEGAEGGIDTLNIEVNSSNYEVILKTIEKAIIKNARGYDAKDDRLGGNANIVNIKSMYSDIDLDANNMEAEFQAAFEELLWFVNVYLANTGQGSYFDIPVTITFNRDMLMNETEVITALSGLGLKLSNETLVGQVPFVNDVNRELERLEEEKQANIDLYGGGFSNASNNS